MKFTKFFTPLFLLIFVGGMVAPVPAMAQTTNQPSTHTSWFAGLFNNAFVEFLAQKLGIDQSKVQSAVENFATTQKQTMQQNMQNREKSRLDKLVSQGKITSDQEQAILTELATLQSKYNPANFKNMTAQQRKQERQQERQDLQTWAKDNTIDLSLILPMGMGRGMGMGGRHGWQKPTVTPTP